MKEVLEPSYPPYTGVHHLFYRMWKGTILPSDDVSSDSIDDDDIDCALSGEKARGQIRHREEKRARRAKRMKDFLDPADGSKAAAQKRKSNRRTSKAARPPSPKRRRGMVLVPIGMFDDDDDDDE